MSQNQMSFRAELEQQFSAIVNKPGKLTHRESRKLELLKWFIRRLREKEEPTSEEELKAMGYGDGPAERTLSVHTMSVPPPQPGVPEPSDL
jgi:hypothetical protein